MKREKSIKEGGSNESGGSEKSRVEHYSNQELNL